MSEAFTDLEQQKWMWCHEGTTLHILWYPDAEEIREIRERWRRNSAGQRTRTTLPSLVGPYALCGATNWKVSDGDKPPVGREDLICGSCLDAFHDRYGTEEQEVKPVSAADRYKKHLESDLWKRTRELALEFYGDRCCLCNSPETLNVHHRTYERVGSERLSDLIVLCRDCHAKHHGQLA